MENTMMRRRTFVAAAAGSALAPALQAQGIDTAKILVGFVPGGLSDAIARRLADKLRGGYAGTVLVENKPGASGQIAITQLKDSPADGSMLLMTHSSALAMYPFTFKKLPYRPMEDLLPVSLVCHTNHALCLGPVVPASVRNVKDFLTWAKANPDKANYGTPGLGSMPHLIMTVVNKVGRADLRPITYRGTAASITDMLGGQISAASGPVGNFLPHLPGGRARLIAISGDTRSSFLPDLATYREQGFPMTAREWYGLYLPGKARPEVQRRAAAYAQAALSDPGLVANLQQSGVDVAFSTPATLASMLDADTREWQRLTKQIGFTAES
ncbi:MAG: twin-arginine translocation pathway signal protein [Burkholderiales bacterium]|nr:twin-arginine translocation pathway signal protein [Burkholderiales bacterium]